MEYKDYYKVLGVERNAEAQEIKKAYRKLAMQHHPDRNQGNKKSEEKFKDINEAYQVLSDPQKRSRYDQLGNSYSNWQQGGACRADSTGKIGTSSRVVVLALMLIILMICLAVVFLTSSIPFSAAWAALPPGGALANLSNHLRCSR